MSRIYQQPTAQLLTVCVFLVSQLTILSVAQGQYLTREARLANVEKTFGDPPNLKRLSDKDRVWVDTKRHIVVVDGTIALRNGQLEMFACPVGTKEHESVVGLFAKAQTVHAALLAAGAKTGKPVQWEPKFEPPTGSEIEIRALWFDTKNQKQSIDARQWVRQFGKEGKALDVNWVFAGSSFWKDPDTGEERYMAESGDLVCLSNFSTATLDVPIRSSQANSGLLFTAFTDRIPTEGTPVRLVFKVVQPTTTTPAAADPGSAATSTSNTAKPTESLELLTPSKTPAAKTATGDK